MARAFVVLCAVLAVTASAHRLRNGKDAPQPDVSDTMARLQPVLDKLRNLDPKSFGALSGMMNQVKPSSFIQFVKDDPQAVDDKLAALGPVLDKLKNLDPKAFGSLNGLMNQVQQGKALIQMNDEPKDKDVDVSGTVDRLQPVLDKLRNLDPKIFGAMSSMIGKAQQDNQK